MPLFEVETESHIIITWAQDQDAAADVVQDAYPNEKVLRLTKRPRDTWVISKAPWGSPTKRPIPAIRPAIACRRQPATRYTPSACTCTKRVPIWNGLAR